MGHGCVGWNPLAQDVLRAAVITVHFQQTSVYLTMGTLQLSFITPVCYQSFAAASYRVDPGLKSMWDK